MKKPRGALITVLANQGPSDTTGPACAITSTSSGIIAGAFSVTITFTNPETSTAEAVTGFALGDITCSVNAGASNLANPSTGVYTATITPTSTGTVTVDVNAGVCTDAAGNNNTAATQFSITAIVYLLRDEFTSDDAAPVSSPRTCEPGPGTVDLVDTGGTTSITGGYLTTSAFVGHGDPGVWGTTGRSRAAGLAVIGNLRTPGGNGYFGFDEEKSSLLAQGAFSFAGANISGYLAGAAPSLLGSDIRNSDTGVGVVLRSTGCFLVYKPSGATAWKLLWIDSALNGATVYPGYYPMEANFRLHRFTCEQLPAPWTTDAGLQTFIAASAGVGATGTMEADALVEATWTAATGVTYELDVRRTDDDNRWVIRCDQGGSTIKIIERNATVETERATAAQTWTNGTPYRIVVLCDTQTIRAYVANVIKVSYTTASFNQTATGIKTSHAVTNLIAWKRVLSGTLTTTLDAV